MQERFSRQARNEALLREVNERIEELGRSAQAWSDDGVVEFLCECGEEGGCGQRVRMPQGGRLYLGVNDDTIGDNRGQFEVTVRRLK